MQQLPPVDETHNELLLPRSSTASPTPCPPAITPAAPPLVAQDDDEDDDGAGSQVSSTSSASTFSSPSKKSHMLRTAMSTQQQYLPPQHDGSATAASLISYCFLLCCELLHVKPRGSTVVAIACASYFISRVRRVVAGWLFDRLPWIGADDDGQKQEEAVMGGEGGLLRRWSKVVSWRTSWFLSRASAYHTEEGSRRPRRDAASSSLLMPKEKADEEEEEDDEQKRMKHLPAWFCAELSRITPEHIHLYALSLGIIPTLDGDLLHELRDVIFSKPYPDGWSLSLSSFGSCGGKSNSNSDDVVDRFYGIRFVDRSKGALRIAHPDIEFGVDGIRHVAQARTRRDPAVRKAEMGKLLREFASMMIFSTNFSSSNSSGSVLDTEQHHQHICDTSNLMATNLFASGGADVTQLLENEDDDVFSTLQLVNAAAETGAGCCSQSPCRLRKNRNNNTIQNQHSHHHDRHSTKHAAPPPTEFDLVSPRRDGTNDSNVSPDTRAHVDKLLDHFSADRGGIRGNHFVVSAGGRSAFDNDDDDGDASLLFVALSAVAEHERQEEDNKEDQQEQQQQQHQQQQVGDADEGGELEGSPFNSTVGDESIPVAKKLVFSSSMQDYVSPARVSARRA